jgi:hypothetical protein
LQVERLLEEYALDEPLDTVRGAGSAAEALPGSAAKQTPPFVREDIQGICVNPLRDEPAPLVVSAVRRFGVVGLVACALGAALLRWYRSLSH